VKRAPFLGASAAVFLSGCGGHHVMQALPGVAPQSSKQSTFSGRLVPEAAETIPNTVLTHPIVGEARRFDGGTAPAGWVLAKGQTLNVAENRPLFSVLGAIAGGDGKSTFKVTSPSFGVIIAVAGMIPTSPSMLALSGRHMTPQDSLGPNAVAQSPRMAKPPSAKLIAERRLLTSAVRAGTPNPVRMAPELLARSVRAKADARATVFEQLGAGNRALLQDAVQRFLSGRIALYDGVTEMAASLTNPEVDAVSQVRDSMIRQFNPNANGALLADPRGEAGRFLFQVSITDEQIAAATARGIDLR